MARQSPTPFSQTRWVEGVATQRTWGMDDRFCSVHASLLINDWTVVIFCFQQLGESSLSNLLFFLLRFVACHYYEFSGMCAHQHKLK